MTARTSGRILLLINLVSVDKEERNGSRVSVYVSAHRLIMTL